MLDDLRDSDSMKKDGQTGAHAMNYMVELFLDENKTIRRTRIHHVQSGQEAAWDNWDDAQLSAFFKKRPELLKVTEHAQPAQTDATEPGAEPVESSTSKPRLRKLEIIPAQSRFPSRSFDRNQPFNVRVYLDLAETKSGGQESFDYTVAILAKRLGAGNQQQFIKDRGKIASNGNLTLNLKWPALPPGVYRLSAALTLIPKDANAASQDELSASLEGGLFEVR